MIAKPERTLSTVFQNKDQTQTPTNNGGNIELLINRYRATALEQIAAEAIGGINSLYQRVSDDDLEMPQLHTAGQPMASCVEAKNTNT